MLKDLAQERRLIGSRDRLITVLILAGLLHGAVILGVGFSGEDHDSSGRTMEVTTVEGNSERAPDDARYLANANQRGEGNTRDQVRPTSASQAAAEADNAGNPDGNAADSTPPQPKQPDQAQNVVTTTADSAHAARHGAEQSTVPVIHVARLMISQSDSVDMQRLQDSRAQAYSDTPRERFIAVNTKESRFAAYLESWRRKVERLGNLHYPDAARRKGLAGTVRLEVAINADGSIRSLETRIPSRYHVLDEAAERIVRLAAPFPPFPADVRRDTDVLRFVYDWKFAKGHAAGTVSTRR